MNFRVSNPQSAFRHLKSLRAFTMVEIAISLAIIGFALVAIIGVLPMGMSVQKDNREQTIINLDAAYLMDALRSGPLGQDNLTNYIVSITLTNTLYNGIPLHLSTSVVNFYTNGPTGVLTNGFNIIGLLSTPKYVFIEEFVPITNVVGMWNNSVTAVFRAINAPAVDQGVSQASKDFAFQYQVTIEIIPSSESASQAINGNWLNFTMPIVTNLPAASLPGETFAQNLQGNLYDIKLTYRWPVLGNGQLGGGRQVFRSSVAGTYRALAPRFPLAFGFPLPNGTNLLFMQAATYTAQTP